MPELQLDTIRPKGVVELECSKCHWASWFDPLHPSVIEAVKTGSHVCDACLGIEQPCVKAGALKVRHVVGKDCRPCPKTRYATTWLS